MSRFYLRRDPGPRENLAAAAVALGVGAVAFFCARILLARDGIEREAPKPLPEGGVHQSAAADSAG